MKQFLTKMIPISAAFIAVFLPQCYYSPVGSPGQIKGSVAKQRLVDAAIEADIVRYAIWKGKGPAAQLILDSTVIPIIAGIDEGKTYKRVSVDECAEQIKMLAFITDSWFSTAICHVEQTQTIQLGPIGIL